MRQVALAQDHVVARGHTDLELLPLVFEGALLKDARLTSRLVTDPRLLDGDPGCLNLLSDAVLQLTQADFRLAQDQSVVREVGSGGPVAQRDVKLETDAVIRKLAPKNLRQRCAISTQKGRVDVSRGRCSRTRARQRQGVDLAGERAALRAGEEIQRRQERVARSLQGDPRIFDLDLTCLEVRTLL